MYFPAVILHIQIQSQEICLSILDTVYIRNFDPRCTEIRFLAKQINFNLLSSAVLIT